MEERVRFEAKFVPGKHDVAMKYFAQQLEEKRGRQRQISCKTYVWN